jgi:RNA polymerase sigma-70 factor, ECF subfamily
VAIGEAYGPAAGLALVERIDGLDSYRYLHSARGELLARIGREAEARAAFERALELIDDEPERRLIARKLAGLSP